MGGTGRLLLLLDNVVVEGADVVLPRRLCPGAQLSVRKMKRLAEVSIAKISVVQLMKEFQNLSYVTNKRSRTSARSL